MKKHIFYFFLPVVIWSACKDDPEQIPAYLDLQPFTVNEPGGAAGKNYGRLALRKRGISRRLYAAGNRTRSGRR